jgi:hypothetical protein
MLKKHTLALYVGISAVFCNLLPAQSPEGLIQLVVNTERSANQKDHSKWTYLEELRKPKEHVVQWVATTQQGDVQRVLAKDDHPLSDAQQRELVNKFVHDSKAQKKELLENSHDNQQVDDFLALLPKAFIWTQTGSDPTNTVLHFEPSPAFHPPTREARVFSSMAGNVVVDNQQHRIRSMSGHLIHEVTFGGGLLGKLKEGSSFALEQAQVEEGQWQLIATHVHLEGNALLFKSISLQQDDQRSKFAAEPEGISLSEAVENLEKKPDLDSIK